MTTETLHDKIRSEVERRLAIARAASQSSDGSTPTGEHWQWECNECDTVVEITDVVLLDELVECSHCRHHQFDLRSREEYPSRSVGNLPHFAVRYVQELRPVDGLFVALHDPADAIRRYEHALWVLDQHQWVAPGVNCGCTDAMCGGHEHIVWPCDDIVRLAESLGIDTGGQP